MRPKSSSFVGIQEWLGGRTVSNHEEELSERKDEESLAYLSICSSSSASSNTSRDDQHLGDNLHAYINKSKAGARIPSVSEDDSFEDRASSPSVWEMVSSTRTSEQPRFPPSFNHVEALEVENLSQAGDENERDGEIRRVRGGGSCIENEASEGIDSFSGSQREEYSYPVIQRPQETFLDQESTTSNGFSNMESLQLNESVVIQSEHELARGTWASKSSSKSKSSNADNKKSYLSTALYRRDRCIFSLFLFFAVVLAIAVTLILRLSWNPRKTMVDILPEVVTQAVFAETETPTTSITETKKPTTRAEYVNQSLDDYAKNDAPAYTNSTKSIAEKIASSDSDNVPSHLPTPQISMPTTVQISLPLIDLVLSPFPSPNPTILSTAQSFVPSIEIEQTDFPTTPIGDTFISPHPIEEAPIKTSLAPSHSSSNSSSTQGVQPTLNSFGKTPTAPNLSQIPTLSYTRNSTSHTYIEYNTSFHDNKYQTLHPDTQQPISIPETQDRPVFADTQYPLEPFTTFTEELLLEILEIVSSDNGQALKTLDTPQYLALDWILNEDSGAIKYSQERIIQRYALATIYFSMKGQQWIFNDGWLSEKDECEWYTSNFQAVPICNEKGKFSSLQLSFNNLQGTIPPEIGFLKDLDTIQLDGGPVEFIEGSLPSELGLLSNIHRFSVRGNLLSGSLPSEVKYLTALRNLNMAYNNFIGNIPTQLGSLTSIQELFLEDNLFQGTVPTEIGNLADIIRFSAGNNFLNGALPTEIGLLQNLRTFNIQKNLLSSSIPSEVGHLKHVHAIYAHSNRMIGPLPTEIGALLAMKSLSLHCNKLSGKIPSEIGLQKLLVTLDLSDNKFSGTIPLEIGRLGLRVLLLQSNRLTGPVPSELAQLSLLNTFRIDDNDLLGAVPNEICYLFDDTYSTFYSDCITEILCPCCTHCCLQTNDQNQCICAYSGTSLDFLC